MVGDESRPAGGDTSRSRVAEVNAWLRAAVEHHQRGELAQAQRLYEQILTRDAAHADALQYFGILCQQRGDGARAEQLIRQAIAARPDVAPYHDNLGTVLEQAGQFEAALAAYRQAERLEPGIAERASNVGLVLQRLGRMDEAERHYRDSIARHPDDLNGRVALAHLLNATGERSSAIAAYREILAINAHHVGALIGLGNLLQDNEQIDAALEAYRAALSREPENAEAWHNQGRALAGANRFAEAQQSFERALRFEPKLLEAKLGLARMFERLGLFERAYAAFRGLCAMRDVADADLVSRARAGLLRVARVLPKSKYDDVLVASMLLAIESGEIVASHFMHALGSQLAAKAGLAEGECVDDVDALQRAVALQSDPLFAVALQHSANVVPAIERWLCAVRRALLQANSCDLDGREPLLHALAMQGFANEYVYAVSDDEIGVIDAVLAQLEPHTASGLLASDGNVRDLLLCACYGPLNELWGAESLADLEPDALGPWLAPIVQRTVIEPQQERERAVGLEELAPIAHASSQLVRAQYEEHPYPRWRELPSVMPADAFSIDSIAAAVGDDSESPFLVAGCGTGFEPLLLAKQFPERSIVALDLSRASLAYASRMAELQHIENVRFVHGDLFDINRLGCCFSLITASGVLHHLADPLAGWRALAEQLGDNGVMKVALYSRRARAVINAARERVAELGLSADTRGVRTLRARVLGGSEPALDSLLDSEDFYTTSMCRDLIFHPLEHQFDLDEIGGMLDSLGLVFAGFELPHSLIKQQFLAARLGDEADLEAWAQFEERNPRTFDGMYVLWCRKVASANSEKSSS